MRKFLKYTLLTCLGLVLASCSKDDDPEPEVIIPTITGFEVTIGSGSDTEVITAVIDGQKIDLTVPAGTNVSALSPQIRTNTGTKTIPASGETVDFSRTRIYRATNDNGYVEYVVTVTVEPSGTDTE